MLEPVLVNLEGFAGGPVEVVFLPELTASRGKLRSGAGAGTPVHAGSDIRKRRMVLDSALLGNRDELMRIFVHEAHHFQWTRLGNARRFEYEAVVRRELNAGARGELGWSAERLKGSLTAADLKGRTRRWRQYVCESYCDTAAWLYADVDGHDEWTLAARHRTRRAEWLRRWMERRPVSV